MPQYAPQDKGEASISQLALPPARGGVGRDTSPSSSDSGGSHSKLGDEVTRVSSYSPYASYPADAYRDESEAPILPPNFPSHTSPEPMYPQPGGYAAPAYGETERQEPGRKRQPSGRGFSLVDTGPIPVEGQVAPHDPVRRVSRQQGQQHRRRSSSRNDLVSPISSSSHVSQLPPGAVSTLYQLRGRVELMLIVGTTSILRF
jgi:chitin synthase